MVIEGAERDRGARLRGGRPRAVGALSLLLVLTAAATVVVEVLAFRYAPDHNAGFVVRTGWALVRTLAWLVLIAQVRRGRAAARPFGLILAVTTIFAVGRLIVPESGAPPLPGVAGFAALTVLCLLVVVLLYRHPAVTGHLTRRVRVPGLDPDRPPLSGWAWTVRVGALTYSPLMLVPALVSVGELGRRPEWILAVVLWFAVALGLGFVVFPITLFAMRGGRTSRRAIVWITVLALVVTLPLCLILLGLDGLIRDGSPLVVAALLTSVALSRTGPSAAANNGLAGARRRGTPEGAGHDRGRHMTGYDS